MILQKRLIIAAGAITRNPFDLTDPQFDKVVGVVGVVFNPVINITLFQKFVPPAPGTFDFWDILVEESFDATGYLRLYEATVDSVVQVNVIRDFFGPGDYTHTWAGWPTPGIDWPPPLGASGAVSPTGEVIP